MNETPQPKTTGEVLAEARAKLGLTLDQLAERTKIPALMLAAIERDEYHRLSGPLYVRSFLRTYAAEVGVDPDEILEIYGRADGDPARGPESGQAQVWRDAEVKVERIGLPWLRILGIALAVIVLVGLILVWALKDRPEGGRRSALGSSVPEAGPLRQASSGGAGPAPRGRVSADPAAG